MLTGYNTDVRFEGVVYHVQSEDRGIANPILDTLIYCGGQILHQEKSSYADLVAGGEADAGRVAARLERQHRDAVRRARHGGFAQLLGEGAAGAGLRAGLGSALDGLGAALFEDADFVPLELTFARDGGAPGLSGDLTIASGPGGEPAAGARVTARAVGLGITPANLFDAEADADGRLAIALVIPPAVTAVVLTAETALGAGKLRVPVADPGAATISGASRPAASRARGSSS